MSAIEPHKQRKQKISQQKDNLTHCKHLTTFLRPRIALDSDETNQFIKCTLFLSFECDRQKKTAMTFYRPFHVPDDILNVEKLKNKLINIQTKY